VSVSLTTGRDNTCKWSCLVWLVERLSCLVNLVGSVVLGWPTFCPLFLMKMTNSLLTSMTDRDESCQLVEDDDDKTRREEG